MNICLFTPSFLPKMGGMEVVVDKLAGEFNRAGHHAVVLAKSPRGKYQVPELDYPVQYYPRSHSQVWFLGSAMRALKKLHKIHNFDIIHAHQAYPTGYVAAKFSQKTGVPAVITSHKGDIWPGSRFRRRRICSNRMVWAMRNSTVTGVSREVVDIIDELTGQTGNFYIPNGVDIPQKTLRPVELDLLPVDAEHGFMLTLGRLHWHKGLNYLLDALADLIKRGIDFPDLVIAGDGKEGDKLKDQVQDLNLGGKVFFSGAVFGDAKGWLLQNCKLFIQPSVTEGMPLTVLEAMAAGRPILATDSGGMKELVHDYKNGKLVGIKDSAALSSALEELLSGQIEFAEYGAASLDFARNYSWEKIAVEYIEIFEQCLKK